MTKNDIAHSLSSVTEGQAFITLSQLAKALGRTDLAKVKANYLRDLEAVNGKYYLIREVAAVLKAQCK